MLLAAHFPFSFIMQTCHQSQGASSRLYLESDVEESFSPLFANVPRTVALCEAHLQTRYKTLRGDTFGQRSSNVEQFHVLEIAPPRYSMKRSRFVGLVKRMSTLIEGLYSFNMLTEGEEMLPYPLLYRHYCHA